MRTSGVIGGALHINEEPYSNVIRVESYSMTYNWEYQ